MDVLLNLDGGEHEDEPETLYALADVVHIACGGHAGDDASMDRVVSACVLRGTRIGAHPSYVDREGFGRRPRIVTPEILASEIAEQCEALARVARRHRVEVMSVKPHGALYHAAHADEGIARACIDGITRVFGTASREPPAANDEAAIPPIAIVGLAGGALDRCARAAGLPYLREAFADRGTRDDGSLIPRGEAGALVSDPDVAAKNAVRLATGGTTETICVHADTPASLEIVRAVRKALDALR